MHKRWKISQPDELASVTLAADLGIDPLLAGLLVERGITSAKKAETFFEPDLKGLHDPFIMKDMEKAVNRLNQAIDKGDKILLYGDYDVDGTTSVALMYTFLSRRYNQLDFYIPDRYNEGYGLSIKGVEYARQEQIDLIVAMDCGIKAVEQVALANTYGIDVIICDHHLPGEELPAATAILDPKQTDCPYPFKDLSGCGIAFKLVQAFEQENSIPVDELKSLLDFLVISIASDIVPMVDENRILARHGLKVLSNTHRPGLLALIELANLRRPLNIRDIVFGIAPLINAAGRLSQGEEAVRLMLARNRQAAREYADKLEAFNLTRREYDQKTAEEAVELIDNNPNILQKNSIVLYQPHWHKGVIGIVASRLAERYHKPTIIITQADGVLVGSARSVSAFDIYEAIEKCNEFLLSYGGHKFAAGMTMPIDTYDIFRKKFERMVAEAIQPEQQQPELVINAELNFRDLKPAFWKPLLKFAPFGPMNPKPVFLSRSVQDAGYTKQLNGHHLRLSMKQGKSRTFYGIAPGAAEMLPEIVKGRSFDICYTLQKGPGTGRNSIQMVIQDIRFTDEEGTPSADIG